MEGTIKTLSPKVNILNFFTDKVDTGLNFNIDLEHPEEMNPEIAMKLLKLADGLTESTTKKAEALDMLEKGQIRVRTDFSFEEKALAAVQECKEGKKEMKMKIIALLLAGCLCFALAACGEDDVQSVLENADAEELLNTAAGSGEDIEEDEGYQIEIPDAVRTLSSEDDRALTGVLTEDSYTNEYFGFKMTRIEGGTIQSLMDEGTDLMPLSQTYTEGIGTIYINSRNVENGESIAVSISALTSHQHGKTENDLAQERFDQEQSLNKEMELESDCSVENITVAGEEHPAYVEIYEKDEGGMNKNASVYIIKNDFLCCVTINADPEKFDDLLKLIEKIG